MATLQEELQSALGSAYTIERELGGGGMSRVFLAEETRLRRKVVVKVLPPELTAGVSAERFEREIMVAARLLSPAIVPVLAAGEASGRPYYTMPFVDGESLRLRLAREGPLPIGETVSLLRDVARALAYAHERGIVHRDIKPENVLLAGGAAVVTDFGIAKAISAARSLAGDATLTTAGSSIGTPAYMAPEQVTGDPETDARADLYSFGCLAYELLTGEPPFGNRPMHKLLAAHLSESPPDILLRRPDCPPALARLIRQCLEKSPAERPASAGDVLREIENVTTPSAERVTIAARAARQRRFTRAPAFVLGALVVLVAAWILVQQRGGRSRVPESASLRSIAVLPFANVGGDTADAYFADGIGEELATALSKVPGLRVVARNSTFRSGGRPIDESEAARTLGVDALLAGSVRRAGPQLRLTARLVRGSDGSILWSEQYEREVQDVFAVQDEVTRAIVAALEIRLAATPGSPSGGGRDPANRGTSNLAAYDLYLRGQFNLHRRKVREAVENFRAAIRLDSNYPRAYAGLSAGLELLPYFGGIPADSVREPAIAAARRALALDSSLAEAHTSIALAYMHANQWTQAEIEHRRAIALDPTDASAHVQYGRMLLATGRFTEASMEFERAEALDPFSPVAAAWVSTMALLSGQKEVALAAGRRAVALDSTTGPALNSLARALLAAGEPDSAMAVSDRLPRVPPWAGITAYVHARAGDPETARRIVREIEAQHPFPWAGWFTIAWAWLGLGDTARALNALERSTDAREIWPNWFSFFDGVYQDARQSSRFAILARRVGVDLARFTIPSSSR